MASGDLIMKLLLNTKDFSNKLGQAGKEVGVFGKKSEGVSTNIAAAFGKITAVAGAVAGAFKLLDSSISSSQALTDMWGRTIESVSTTFDNFIYSISNADFTPFANGMDNIIAKAREMYGAYDQLQNTMLSVNFATTLDQAKYRELMAIARDKNRPMEERRSALDEARVMGSNISQYAIKAEQDSYKALAAMFAAKTGANASLFTPELIEKAFRIDAGANSAAERARIEEQYKQYQAEMAAAEGISGSRVSPILGGTMTTFYGDAEEEARVKKAVQAKYAEVIAQQLALMRLDDKTLEDAMRTYLSAVQQRNVAAEILTSTNEVGLSMGNETTAAYKTLLTARNKQRDEAAAIASMQYAVYEKPFWYGMSDMAGISFDNSHLNPLVFAGRNPAKRYKRATAFEPSATIAPIQDTSFFDIAKQNNTEEVKDVGASIKNATDAVGLLGEACGLLAQNADSSSQKILSFAATMLQTIAAVMSASSPVGVFSAVLGGAGSLIPKFADGRIVSSPTIAMVGEAGTEAVIPIDRLNDYVGTKEMRVSGRIQASGKDLNVIIENYNKVRSVKHA